MVMVRVVVREHVSVMAIVRVIVIVMVWGDGECACAGVGECPCDGEGKCR
jgi:hypothetical protein